MYRRDFCLGTTTASLVVAVPAWADGVRLVIDGDLAESGPLALSDADLSVFPPTNIETTTTWTDGLIRFSGPLLSDVLAHYGAGSGDLELGAINNYRVVVDRDLITGSAPIIANRRDGQPFSVRTKGLFWVIFPYDSSPDFQTELAYAASVWQLASITILKD